MKLRLLPKRDPVPPPPVSQFANLPCCEIKKCMDEEDYGNHLILIHGFER